MRGGVREGRRRRARVRALHYGLGEGPGAGWERETGGAGPHQASQQRGAGPGRQDEGVVSNTAPR